MDALQVRRSKVNGKFLQDNIGKEITILGEVIKANPDSNTMEIKTTDNCVVNVIMNNQFEETYTGWVEIRGQAQGKNVVIGSHCISFPSHIFKDFDRQGEYLSNDKDLIFTGNDIPQKIYLHITQDGIVPLTRRNIFQLQSKNGNMRRKQGSDMNIYILHGYAWRKFGKGENFQGLNWTGSKIRQMSEKYIHSQVI